VSQQINLFNPIFLTQKKYFSTIAMVEALGMLLVGAALVCGYAAYQATKLRQEAEQTTKQLAVAQQQLVEVSAKYGVKPKNQSLEQQVKKTEGDIQSLRQIFDILQKGDIGNTKGYSGYMKAFARQIADGVWLTGITLVGAGNEIALEGRAVQPELVPAYMNRLKREPLMQGKSFGTLEMQVPQGDPGKDAAGKDAGKPKTELAGYIDFRLH
jgi:Tfp pilus assembly protein PilN